jgi:hypothetical protein
MNIFFNYRLTLSTTLYENTDVNKLIKSIKKLSKSNNNIFIIGKCESSDVNDNCIYFTIQNNILKINYSHIFYDGYSIWLIFQKIDKVYKNEIKNYTFKIYDNDYSTLKIVINTIKLLPKINIKNVYNSLIKNKIIKTKIIKTKIKILKTDLNEMSTKEIMHYLVDKLELKEYCLIINARKQHNEYENVLGNLLYYSGNLNKKTDIRTQLQNNKNKISLQQKLNSVPTGLLVNSYLNFTLPSFSKYFTPPIPSDNYIVIHPVNNNEKYILVDYYS